MKGLDSFRKKLESSGWKTASNCFGNEWNECDWYAWRPVKHAARECELNQKRMSITLKPSLYTIANMDSKKHEGVELEICGEAGGIWFLLKAYSLKPKEFLAKEKQVERMLVNAWNSLIKKEVRK